MMIRISGVVMAASSGLSVKDPSKKRLIRLSARS